MLTNAPIRAKADQFRIKNFVAKQGFNPIEVLEAQGITHVNALKDLDSDLSVSDDPSSLGAANTETKQIFVRPVLYEKMERFTIAHEIGHIALHQGKGTKLRLDNLDAVLGYSNSLPDDEKEANYFAAELLLPREEILNQLIEEFTISSFKEIIPEEHASFIGDIFKVSLSAATVRLSYLRNFA